MSFQSGITNSYSGYDYSRVFDPCKQNLGLFDGVLGEGSSQFQDLVLDGEKEEPVKADPKVVGKKENLEAKAVAALKSHSEAERRRRQRINAHLDTLRGLVPSTDKKMDKATLLADVLRQVKELKKNAIDATEGLVIPMDADVVRVEPQDDGNEDGTYRFRASICSDYRPALLSELRQALDGLKLTTVEAEISTFKGRLMNVFIFSRSKEGISDDAETRRICASSIQEVLNFVLDNALISLDYSPRPTFQNKRQKISFLDSSSSSS